MGLFNSKKTKKVSAALVAPAAPAAPTAPEANIGLSKQPTSVTPATHLDKGHVFIKKYNGKGEDSRKIHLILQENINLPNDEKAVKRLRDPKKVLPWDVVVIMTTKWLLVAHLQPQKTEEIMQTQASQIWEEAENYLKMTRIQEILIQSSAGSSQPMKMKWPTSSFTPTCIPSRLKNVRKYTLEPLRVVRTKLAGITTLSLKRHTTF